MNPLHEQFIVEARELTLQATDDLVATEREGSSPERIDRIFRAFHTLKGAAGMVDLPAMSTTLHAAEDLVAAMRIGTLQPTRTVVSQALECLDQVSRWIESFQAHGRLPARAGDEARAMSDKLRGHLSSHAPTAGAATARAPGEVPDWVPQLVALSRERIVGMIAYGSTPLFAIVYEPHAACFFDGDDPLQLLRRLPGLVALQVTMVGPQASLEELDPFFCTLRLQAIAAGERDAISETFRSVPDQVRVIDLPPGAWPDEAARHDDRPIDAEIDAVVRAVLVEQRAMLAIAGDGDLRGYIGAAARAAANALRHGRRKQDEDSVARAGAAAVATGNLAELLAAIDAAMRGLAPAEQASAIDAGTPALQQARDSDAGRWLRVDGSRVDALFNLAGELIVLKNNFAHLARRIEAEAGGSALSRAAWRENEAIERIASSMHDAILQLRVVPIATILRAVPRLLRDLSHRLGKSVELVTRGATTESDKAVVDRLFEPLMHLVRNALDHGIESPEERRAAGKAETGRLTIAASRLGNRMLLEVRDDGRGIDPAAIRRKAHERGVVTGDAMASLSDEQSLDLIFAAGLSTAAEVSDISGRGVGMDVVRSTVEQLGGRVLLSSRVGFGTTVRLDVPVSIATSHVMVVECAGQTFGVPLDGVAETVRLTADRIHDVKSNQGLVHRDKVVPICSLAEVLHLPRGRPTASDTRLMIVMDFGGSPVAVEVDAIRDHLDVVLKPMQGLLANTRGYLGTALLGDGTVLLVVDLKDMIP